MLRCFIQDVEKLSQIECPISNVDDPRVVWLDMLDPTPEEVTQVEAYMGINIPTADEMAEIELSDRLYFEHAAVYMTMTTLSSLKGEAPIKTQVTFVLKDDRLVTVRHKDFRSFRYFSVRAMRAGAVSAGTGELVMLGLMETIIDRRADSLEKAADEIDSISHEVFRPIGDAPPDRNLQLLIERIGRKGDLLTKVQESLVSMGRVMAFYNSIDANTLRKSAKEAKQRAKLIQRDVVALSEHTNFLSSKINFMLEATLGLINLEQNRIIKIFSVGSMVMLPPTLVASAYGMNFQMMPELNWSFGYPFALALMVLSAVVPYLYFKHRRWL
jgi:magnesium transporter